MVGIGSIGRHFLSIAFVLFVAFAYISNVSPSTSSINVSELLQLLKIGDYVRVKDICSTVISIFILRFSLGSGANSETAFYYRGLASQAMLDFEDALKDFTSAIESSESNAFTQVFAYDDDLTF